CACCSSIQKGSLVQKIMLIIYIYINYVPTEDPFIHDYIHQIHTLLLPDISSFMCKLFIFVHMIKQNGTILLYWHMMILMGPPSDSFLIFILIARLHTSHKQKIMIFILITRLHTSQKRKIITIIMLS
ncbi:hypothetical protein ACJX0J_026172, partial [Zea mays]